jgi:hypothetical protein
MDLKTLLLKIARVFQWDVDSTHVSDVYIRTGLINVFYNMVLLFYDSVTLNGSLIHNIYWWSKFVS